MPTPDHLEGYLRHLRDDLHRAPSTVAGYRAELAPLFPRGNAFTAEGLAAFVSRAADGRTLAPTTRNRRLAVVRGFARYLVRHGVLEQDPTTDLRRAKVHRPRRTALALGELARVAAAIAGERSAWRRTRDLATLSLFFYTGLRLSELCRLRRDQIDASAGVLRAVRRKGGSFTDVVLHADARRALVAWLQVRGEDASPYLFTGKGGRPLTARAVQKRLRGHGLAAGLGVSLHPHRLRHAHATGLLRVGVPTELIRESMNHRSLTTTELYLHGDEDLLRAAIARLPSLPAPPPIEGMRVHPQRKAKS